MKKKRVIIIGLDGVPYNLLEDLSEKDILPNIGSIIKNGIFKKIKSTIPEVSSVAWSSIITGRNPAEHGIFGFTDLEKNIYKLYFPNFKDLKTPAFWNRNNNLRYIIVNVPSTYPALPLNGILVSGFIAPVLEKSVFPSSLIDMLKDIGYRTDVDSQKAHTDIEGFIDDLFIAFESQLKLFNYLYRKKTWDVFMFVFSGTDRLMHFLWDAYEDPSNKYHQIFLDYFSRIDKAIGQLLGDLKKGDLMLIFSDHGFEKLEKDIYVNRILEKNGLLELSEQKDLGAIDERTKAFALDPARIYVNKKGKFSKGGVDLEEDKLIDQIQDMFRSLKINGRKAIRKIYKKQDIYTGPYLDYAPDLILLSEPGFNLRAGLSSEEIASQSIFKGKHTYENAFFLTNDNLLENISFDFSVVEVGRLIEEIILKNEA